MCKFAYGQYASVSARLTGFDLTAPKLQQHSENPSELEQSSVHLVADDGVKSKPVRRADSQANVDG